MSEKSMPGNRKFQGNGPATDRIEEGLKVEGSDSNGPGLYPDQPGNRDCRFYSRTGSCGYGINCRFNHPSNGGQVDTGELPERAGQQDCEFYLKTGTCKFGWVCKYNHPKDKQPDKPVMNSIGLPMRQNVKACPFYMRTKLCKYGSACKFHHPQPMLDLATYYASSLPLYPSQSQGWNAYMGSVNPIGSVLTPPAVNGHLSVSYLPSRPDQPECRYFMNSGSCYYGSECSYHHPMEKISQLASSGSIGPLGLPLRPGQPVCPHYVQYGLCQYGPICRHDHPLDGCSYTYIPYVPTVPPLTTAFPPSAPYPIMAPPPPVTVSDAPYPIIAPPPPPVKVSDPKRVKNGSTAGNHKNQHVNAETNGDSSDQVEFAPQSSKPSSEVTQNGGP
ncbi:hypothetical protein CASFOL_031335 [Castilleja foliolosa]|uniref:C3H1-type domain-containing protein n=1 Tax=Castilleja foliolosa TaxID=1961234 RepID=A0ABD3C539_9LAMI